MKKTIKEPIGVEDIIKTKIREFGNSAHITVNKKHIGKECYVIIIDKIRKRENPLVFMIERPHFKYGDPRIHEVDWKEYERLEKEWKEFDDKDGYFPKKESGTDSGDI